MNTQLSKQKSSSTYRVFPSRAQFSPVLPHTTQASLTRSRAQARLSAHGRQIIPRAESLSPNTPVLGSRWWNPHVVDRLQFELSRVRD